MPTKSIEKNIVISDEKSARTFVEALEKAESVTAEPVFCNVKELKGEKDINAFFGEKMEKIK